MFVSSFSLLAGLGGGSMFTPIFGMFFYFDTRTAMAYSNCFIVINCFGNLMYNMTSHDPDYNHMPVINYNLAIASIPSIFLGTFLGVIMNETLPEGF